MEESWWKDSNEEKVQLVDYHQEKNMKRLKNLHPGEILKEEFLDPMGISQNRIAREIGVHPRRINEIVLGKRAVTADMALRLARYFGTSAAFWLGLQAEYDIRNAEEELETVLKGIHPVSA